MIDAKCPHCKATVSVPESLAGRTEQCPECDRTLPIPQVKARRACRTSLSRVAMIVLAAINVPASMLLAAIVNDRHASPCIIAAGIVGAVFWAGFAKIIELLQDIAAGS